MKSILLAALAALCLTAVAQPAAAETEANPRSRMVSYADLDLTADAGVARLYERLQRAAVNVCRDPGMPLTERRRLETKCQLETLNAAVAQSDLPQIQSWHALAQAEGAKRGARFAHRAR